MTTASPAVAAYIRAVLDHIPRTSPDRGRIEEDLRTHLAERVEAGDTAAAAIAAMGDPIAVATSYLGGRPLRYAPYGRRLVAAVLDYWLLSAAVMLPAAIAIYFLIIKPEGMGGSNGFSGVVSPWLLLTPFMAIRPSVELSGWSVAVFLMLFASGAVISMIYFPVTEVVFGQTVGKWLLGLAVVKESGLAIGPKEALIRRLPYFLQAMVVIDALFVFFGPKRQRAFDRVAGTVVVETS